MGLAQDAAKLSLCVCVHCRDSLVRIVKSCSHHMIILGARRNSERMVVEVALMVRQRVFSGQS